MIFARKGFSLARTKKEYSRKVNQMKRTIALCLALIMALGLLAGCNQTGTEKDPGTTPDGTNQGTNQGTAEQSEKTLIMRAESAFTTLDPANSNNTHDIKLYDQIYEGLYGMNEASGGYYKELAKDVQVSDDSLVYTITLQDGVTFQNGETLTASDCVFTYERAMTFAAMNYLTTMIESVEAPDDQTFVIKMKYAYAPLAHTLFRIKILEEGEVTAQGDKFGTIPNTAGTGAYYVKEYDVASGAKLTSYENYWQGAPNIKNVEYRVLSDAAASVIAYENGELDYYEDAALSDWDSLYAKAGESHSTMVKGNNIIWMGINYASKNKEVLNNDLVRQAMFYAINKEDVNIAVAEGYGNAADTYMVPEYVPTQPTTGFETYAYNPEKAKELLAQAGYADGVDVGTILSTNSSHNSKTAQVIQANLEAVGIHAEVEMLDVSLAVEKWNAQDYDLCVYADSGNYDFNNIRQQVHSESVGMYVINYTVGDKFDWKRIEELVALGAGTADENERLTYYTELWSMVMDTATILPLINRPVAIVWSERINIGDPFPTYYKIRNFTWAE